MTENCISFNNVTVKFGSATALRDVSMEIGRREIVAIVGPNGAGKTTLLKAAMGLIKPGSGSIKIFGESPSKARNKGVFGYVGQISLYDERFPLSAKDVVALSRYAKKKFIERLNRKDNQIISDSLETVGMSGESQKRFGDLSGGQRQRVLIARALAFEPKILLLDEPSTGLDTVAQETFYELLLKLKNEKGLTIVIVSHDIGAVSRYVDTIACLKEKIHFHGKLEGFLSDENLKNFFGDKINILVHDENCATCKRNNVRNI